MIKLKKDISQLSVYLSSKNWKEEGEEIEKLEIPGEGNMNFTLRVITNKRSFIVKQSRDYVEKYPQVAAPADRSQREAEFYNAIEANPSLNKMTPNLIATDTSNNIIVMEDLGTGTDFSYLYNADKVISNEDLKEVMDFASRLHQENKVSNAKLVITNRSMRKLNHEHMFIYPFMEENGLDLNDILPGLSDVAAHYKKDEELLSIIKDLGEKYLSDGDTLLHGDYFPGSWLKTEDGIKIIDPEFCFYGYPEFEIGVCVAHLMMSDQPVDTIFNAFKYYNENGNLDMELCKQCVGVEIMRRIMGLAQLPLKIDLEKRAQLLETALEYIMN